MSVIQGPGIISPPGKGRLRPIYHKSKPKAKGDSAPIPTLAEFVKQSWVVLEPATVLDWNWHLDAICLHVQETLLDWKRRQEDSTYEQRIQNLLINVPPGSGKSRLVSVCTPAWFWLHEPAWRALFLSANPRVSLRDSVYCRDLIESDWYRQTFKPSWKLRVDNNAKSSFWNTAGGFRNAFGFNSKITGDRGDAIFIDDPHDADEVESDVKRLAVINRWDGAIQNRVNDLRTSVRIGIMQRVHEVDWAGHVQSQGGWDVLLIRQEYEKTTQPTALGWLDPREKKGELMFPERFPDDVVEGQKRVLGARKYAAQHQQNPSPAGGNMFKIRNWRMVAKPLQCKRFLISLDATFKDSAKSDRVAVTVLGQTTPVRTVSKLGPLDVRTGQTKVVQAPEYQYFVRSMWADRAGITETQRQLLRCAEKNPDAYVKLIEDKANGPAIIQQMSSILEGIEAYEPGTRSKEERAAAIEPIHERGDICIMGNQSVCDYLEAQGRDSITVGEWWDIYPPEHQSNAEYAPVAEWCKELINECAAFPNGAYDDRVDALDQGINWFEANVIPVFEYKTTGTKRIGGTIRGY
jgi:phage terminase large subunit-like protein